MTHYFDFIVRLKNGDEIRQRYKGKSSRHTKVQHSILKDLYILYKVYPKDIDEFFLKQVKVK
jgi:hypothetical protein